MITKSWRTAAAMFLAAVIAAAAIAAHPAGSAAVAAPRPSPSPSPTNEPTPYMSLDRIPNGSWDVIEQTIYAVNYSRMTLKEAGDSVTGTWFVDKNTTYVLDGSRQGSHLTLQIKSKPAADAPVLGKMEADIDGIADMVGLITLGTFEIPFQGAQHGRVPAPVDAATPAPEESPY